MPLGPREEGREVISVKGGMFPGRSPHGLPTEAKGPHPVWVGAHTTSSGPTVHISFQHYDQ